MQGNRAQSVSRREPATARAARRICDIFLRDRADNTELNKAEREASGDPRLSIEERYGSREAYVAKVKAAADALVAERLLLPADAAAYVSAAEKSDRFAN